MLAGGSLCLPPNVLKAVRQAIYDNVEEYISIVEDPEFKKYFPVVGEDFMKTAPKGFPKDFKYIDYLKCHPSDTCEDVVNTERGLMRKVSSLRSFYSYFFRNELIEKNPAALVRMPKLHEKEIIRLEIDEVAKLLDEVEEGDKLTEKQKLYHERTKVRDLAMMSLLLGTGIRVSECVGLNINDIDLDTAVPESTGKAARNRDLFQRRSPRRAGRLSGRARNDRCRPWK